MTTPRFLTEMRVADDGGFPFRLIAPLVYQSPLVGTIRVPVGFKTDLASIPRVLWNVLPPVGRYDAAAVVHDDLYQTGRVYRQPVTRRLADAVLYEAMTACGVSPLTRWVIWSGVRLGGGLVWKRYRSRPAPLSAV